MDFKKLGMAAVNALAVYGAFRLLFPHGLKIG